MHNNTQNRFKQFTGILMLVFFVSFWASSNVFVHVHVVNNKTIAHSHPFSSNNSSHQHSTDQLCLIYHLSHFITSNPDSPLYALNAFSSKAMLLEQHYGNILLSFDGNARSLRASPTC